MSTENTQNQNNEEMMQLSPWDFDQSPKGWRKFENTKEYSKAVKVLRAYISRNKERIINPRKGERNVSLGLMYFHIGQLLASQGEEYYSEAMEAFNEAFQSDSQCWNAYVSATIGFLENNIEKVEEAIRTIENSQEKDKRAGNIGIVRNFKKAIEIGERDYEKAYLWPREPSYH